MNSNMRIALDLDDTIIDTDEFLLNQMSFFYHVDREYLINNNYSYINMSDELKKQEKNFIQEMFENKLLKIPLKTNAKENINKLFEQGNEIYIITSRHFFKDVYNSTFRQLNNYGIKFTKLICTKNKKDACINNKIDVFVDDSLSNTREVENYVKSIFVFESRYNKNKDNGIKKVKDWEELYTLISNL